MDVSGNGFGGIEVSGGDAVLTVDDATVVNTTESKTAPTAWTECGEDGADPEGTVIGADWYSVVYEKVADTTYQIWWVMDLSNAPSAE